jgi:hypothetical protein
MRVAVAALLTTTSVAAAAQSSADAGLDAPKRTNTRAWLTFGTGLGGGSGFGGFSGLAQVAVQYKRHALLARTSGASEFEFIEGSSKNYGEGGVLYAHVVNNRVGYALAGVGIGVVKRSCNLVRYNYTDALSGDSTTTYPPFPYHRCKQITGVPLALEGGVHVNSFLRFGLNVFANASSYGLFGGGAFTIQVGYFGKRERQ